MSEQAIAIDPKSQVLVPQQSVAIATRQLSLTVFVVVVVFTKPKFVTAAEWMAVN